MPPRVNERICEAVGEAQDGQRTGDRKLDVTASRRCLVPITGHVHAAGDKVGHPSDDETAAGEEHYLDGLPLGQRFIGARRGGSGWRETRRGSGFCFRWLWSAEGNGLIFD